MEFERTQTRTRDFCWMSYCNVLLQSYYRYISTKYKCDQARRQRGAGGALPSRFSFLPPSIYLLLPTVFFWEEKVAVFGRKNRLNLWFRPEKAFGFRRRPFFFWRSPDFHWNFTLIQFKNNESLGQVQCWFSALPPDFNFAPTPISRSWRRPWMWQAMHHLWQGEISYLNKNKNNWIRFYSLATALF